MSVDPSSGVSVDPGAGVSVDPGAGVSVDPGAGVSVDPGAGEPAEAQLRWHATVKVAVEGALAALALLAAAVTGDVALVAFACPLALAAGLGLSRPRLPSLSVTTSAAPLVSGPGAPIEIALEIRSESLCICNVALSMPVGLGAEQVPRWTLLLRPGVPSRVTCTVRARRAGRFVVGTAATRAVDVTGSIMGHAVVRQAITVESRPDPLALRTLVRPDRVRVTVGDRVARLAGDGIEFAEVREEAAGALERRINWRATARRGATCVNVQHPERSTDVVLLADTYTDALLPAVIAVSVSLADAYLRRHDRVGLIALGGVLDWVEPGTGPSHFERIRRAMLASETFLSYAWKTADVIPRRLFPAGCLVLAVTPLGDPRFVATLASLRSRGIDVAVIEVEPPWPAAATESEAAALARRIVEMERAETRRRFFRVGVPVATLEGPEGIAGGLAEIAAFRRSAPARWSSHERGLDSMKAAP